MYRILVVDDSHTARALMVLLLEQDPEIEVVGEATNGSQAVEMAKQLQPDCIIMDVIMPDMDGLEATRRIMAKHPKPILIVTALSDTPSLDMAFEAMKAGALDLFTKPVGFGQEKSDEWVEEFLVKDKTLALIQPPAVQGDQEEDVG